MPWKSGSHFFGTKRGSEQTGDTCCGRSRRAVAFRLKLVVLPWMSHNFCSGVQLSNRPDIPQSQPNMDVKPANQDKRIKVKLPSQVWSTPRGRQPAKKTFQFKAYYNRSNQEKEKRHKKATFPQQGQ